MKTEKDNKPTILMIGVVAPPLGGMATSLNNLITSDLKDKYNICVLDITGFRTRKKGKIFHGVFHQISLFVRLLCLLIEKRPCIVHFHMKGEHYFLRRSIDIIICKLFGKKVIFHLRGGRFIEYYDKGTFLNKFFIKFILNISDKTIALSKFWQDFLAGIMNPERIIVIPNGAVCSEFKQVKDKKKELGFSDERIFILFMGPIGERKGAFDLLKAVSLVTNKIKEAIFIFCGTGEFEGEVKIFLDLIKRKNIGEFLKYTQGVSGQEKYDYYLSSDIFVLPSYAENLPNSLLEAMAAGLPVVVSNVGAIPEIIEDGVNGFIVNPGDVNSIAEKIIKLAEDSNLRKSMQQRNLKLVKEKYDMPIIVEKIDKLYQELLK